MAINQLATLLGCIAAGSTFIQCMVVSKVSELQISAVLTMMGGSLIWIAIGVALLIFEEVYLVYFYASMTPVLVTLEFVILSLLHRLRVQALEV
jgi:hypothetical protein